MSKKLLTENFEYVTERIRHYKFSPPFNYDCCLEFVLKRLEKKIVEYDENKSSIKTFLSRYIKHYVYNYYRDNKQQPTLMESKKLEEIVSDTYSLGSHTRYSITEDTEINARTPERDYWKDQRDIAIAYCINELDSKSRNILLMYFFDNKNGAEIARILGISRQAVSIQKNKALDKIKPKIEKQLKIINDIKNGVNYEY